jgi:hypothetical protein
MNMLEISAVLFGLAALGGLTMVFLRMSRRTNPPAVLAMGHGLMAAAGLTLLAWTAWRVGVPDYAQIALGLFVLAAIGGAVLNLGFHQRGKLIPTGIMLGHAAIAVVAFVLLLCGIEAMPG